MTRAADPAVEAIDRELQKVIKDIHRIRKVMEDLPTLEANLQALKRTRAILAKERPTESVQHLAEAAGYRPPSMAARIMEILQEAGKPMPVNEVMRRLTAEGKTPSKFTVVGTLARYTREGKLRRIAESVYALPGG